MVVTVPVAGALVSGAADPSSYWWALIALVTVAVVLAVAVRTEVPISRFLQGRTNEVMLLSVLGFALLFAGVAESLRVSAAVGALLAGILLSGPLTASARALLAPLRDLFAALFFFFQGLGVVPHSLAPILGAAVLLALAGSLSKAGTILWAARRTGLSKEESRRAGILMIPRGEFSVALAALGSVIEPRLVTLAVAYVVLLSFVTPILYRITEGRDGSPRSRLAPD